MLKKKMSNVLWWQSSVLVIMSKQGSKVVGQQGCNGTEEDTAIVFYESALL